MLTTFLITFPNNFENKVYVKTSFINKKKNLNVLYMRFKWFCIEVLLLFQVCFGLKNQIVHEYDTKVGEVTDTYELAGGKGSFKGLAKYDG